MASLTPYGETTGRAISEILKRAKEVDWCDGGAIFRQATNAQSVESTSFIMGLWVFDIRGDALEAARVLARLLDGSGARIWIEPAIHSAMNEQDGWVVLYSLDLADRVAREPAELNLEVSPV